MSTIHKAIVRSYNAGTHTASVQLTGSLAHYLAGIRVATNIPAAAVVAGRECTLLALDPNNPTDALVLSIQGALPPAGGGGVTDHADLTSLAYADADHTGFCALANAQTITGEKLIDQTVGLRFGHAAGPLLQGEASGDRLLHQGRLLLGYSNPSSVNGLEIIPTGTISGSHAALRVAPSSASLASGASMLAVEGYAVLSVPSGGTPTMLRGLNFFGAVAGGGGGSTVGELSCIRTRGLIQAYTGTIAAAKGLFVDWFYTLSGAPVITSMWGIHVTGIAGSGVAPGTVYGLQIGDIALGTNRYLLELGPATPNLRLLANAPPNAGLATEGDSQLFLAWMENGAVNLRRVRWRQQSSLLATDKVLIAA